MKHKTIELEMKIETTNLLLQHVSQHKYYASKKYEK